MNGLREQLHAIYQSQGELTPQGVVSAARDETHPLHTSFEWDDSVAGERYRETQARALIRSVKIVINPADPESDSAPEFVSVSRPTGRTYMPTVDVAADPFLAELVLRQAEREWRAFRRRYAHLQAVIELVRADVA